MNISSLLFDRYSLESMVLCVNTVLSNKVNKVQEMEIGRANPPFSPTPRLGRSSNRLVSKIFAYAYAHVTPGVERGARRYFSFKKRMIFQHTRTKSLKSRTSIITNNVGLTAPAYVLMNKLRERPINSLIYNAFSNHPKKLLSFWVDIHISSCSQSHKTTSSIIQ